MAAPTCKIWQRHKLRADKWEILPSAGPACVLMDTINFSYVAPGWMVSATAEKIGDRFLLGDRLNGLHNPVHRFAVYETIRVSESRLSDLREPLPATCPPVIAANLGKFDLLRALGKAILCD